VTKKTDIQTPYFRTYGRARFTIFPKLCMVIEHVVPIRKRWKSFFDPIHSFSARGQNVDFWPVSKFKYRLMVNEAAERCSSSVLLGRVVACQE